MASTDCSSLLLSFLMWRIWPIQPCLWVDPLISQMYSHKHSSVYTVGCVVEPSAIDNIWYWPSLPIHFLFPFLSQFPTILLYLNPFLDSLLGRSSEKKSDFSKYYFHANYFTCYSSVTWILAVNVQAKNPKKYIIFN